MAQKSLTAANDAITIDLSKFRNGTVRLTTGSTGHASGAYVVEIEGVTGEWIAIYLWNQLTHDWVSGLTGVSQTGWADVAAARKARVRRTDSNGTASPVAFEFRED